MPTLSERIRAACDGTPREFWPKIVATRAQEGAWDIMEALTALRDLREPPAPPQRRWRQPPRGRLERWEERPKTPSGRFVQAISLDPVLDWNLTDGATRCLQLVTSLAGGVGRAFITLTSSIAKQLGRTTRTVQNYWNELTDNGWLERDFCRQTGLVTVRVTKDLRPPPKPEQPKDWPRLPAPRAGWKPQPWAICKPRARGGAKFNAHIKPKVSTDPVFEAALIAAEDHFHPS